jgi:hypothetical protein
VFGRQTPVAPAVVSSATSHARDVSYGSSDWSASTAMSNMSISDNATPVPSGGVSSGGYYDAQQGTQSSGGSGYETPVPNDYQGRASAGGQESTGGHEKEVDREVEIEPGEDAIPGVRPRMKIRGGRGTMESLNPGEYSLMINCNDANLFSRVLREDPWL